MCSSLHHHTESPHSAKRSVNLRAVGQNVSHLNGGRKAVISIQLYQAAGMLNLHHQKRVDDFFINDRLTAAQIFRQLCHSTKVNLITFQFCEISGSSAVTEHTTASISCSNFTILLVTAVIRFTIYMTNILSATEN